MPSTPKHGVINQSPSYVKSRVNNSAEKPATRKSCETISPEKSRSGNVRENDSPGTSVSGKTRDKNSEQSTSKKSTENENLAQSSSAQRGGEPSAGVNSIEALPEWKHIFRHTDQEINQMTNEEFYQQFCVPYLLKRFDID